MPSRSSRLRARVPAWLLALAAAVSSAGCATRPSPQSWLDVGFRSPRQTFHTFQTAMAADQPELEYRCLSSNFRRREGLSKLGYREFRDRLLRDKPWIRKLSDAHVLSDEPQGGGGRVLTAEVDSWFQCVRFQVHLVPEGFVEVWGGEELLHDDALPAGQRAWQLRPDAHPPVLELSIPLPASSPIDPQHISELRGGAEWKIDSFEILSP